MDTDDWKDYADMSKARRRYNRESSAELLTKKGVKYYTHNDGVHLIIPQPKTTYDFWPGTGKWHDRRGKWGRGVFELLEAIKNENQDK